VVCVCRSFLTLHRSFLRGAFSHLCYMKTRHHENMRTHSLFSCKVECLLKHWKDLKKNMCFELSGRSYAFHTKIETLTPADWYLTNYIPASYCSITIIKLCFSPSTYNNSIIETCLLSLHVSARSSHHQVPEF
jgi:hypothetical protein